MKKAVRGNAPDAAALEERDRDLLQLLQSLLGDELQSHRHGSDMLELVSREARNGHRHTGDWDALVERAEQQLSGEEFLDVLYMRARTADRERHASERDVVLAQAQPLLASHPLWRRTFARLQ